MSITEAAVTEIICSKLRELDRPDLFRMPLIAFSAAADERYAQLKTLVGSWHLHPTDLLPQAKSVISYFIPFTKEVVCAPKQAKQEAPLWGEAYAVLNAYFEEMSQSVCDYLTARGYASCTIPATHTYNEADMKSMWSHRSAAAIAGLGAFGANRMLITEKGSGGRFCTVLTAAAFEVNRQIAENRCLYMQNGSCGLCFQACPVHALEPGVLDRFACQAETRKNEKRLEESIGLYHADICGKCISICPVAYIE